MAEKLLKSIKFPGLNDVYIIPEGGSGTIDIELEGSNEGEVNPINADTLGGYSAEYFLNNTMPNYMEEDEGKILRIVNGVPTWVAIPNVREGTF